MNIPSRIDLKVGERYTLRLPGKGATGHQWSFSIAGDEQAIHISTKTASLENAVEDNIPLPGASADEVMTIQALQPGVTTIHLILHRPWDVQKPPAQEHTVTVYIQE